MDLVMAPRVLGLSVGDEAVDSTHSTMIHHNFPSPTGFLVLSAESDLAHDAFCLSECRKEKDEQEYYCYSEFGKYTSKPPFQNPPRENKHHEVANI